MVNGLNKENLNLNLLHYSEPPSQSCPYPDCLCCYCIHILLIEPSYSSQKTPNTINRDTPLCQHENWLSIIIHSKLNRASDIYTVILLKSVCLRSQTTGRNSCSIVSGDVSNCSYRMKVHPVTSSRLSSAYQFFLHAKNIHNFGEIGWPARVFT